MTDIERRTFLLWAAGSAAASFLAKSEPDPFQQGKPASAPAQSKPSELKPGAQPDGSFVLDPASPPKLDVKPKEEPNGYFVKIDADTVLVAQTPDKKSWIAVSAVCTHKQSWVCYKPDDRCFRCPSHGSKYSETGKVTKGPAKQDLTAYQAVESKGSGGAKLVRVSKR
ncbi:MAG TPA: ubiquinol-cytochrome c reductase iron-sulfur subunit [Planctomycetota bacterium]|nr:ubiquinol-cytochrome c reductase iron-sulfur subunit [Planctomycetota bacterium]